VYVSSINIEVVDVTIEDVPKPKGGTYEKATVVYKGYEGKLESKALMGFATPKEVWEVVVKAKKGDTFTIEREKDPSGKYWNWVAINRQDMPVKTTAVPSKPTYETPDERAQRQVYIIRQSSIASAVAMHGPKANVNDVLKTATLFVDFVMQQSMETLEDDPV
jgi:hypothetical protein